MTELIKNTPEYKRLVEKTPFLKSLLLKPKNVAYIEMIIYQIEKFGEDFVKDKSYSKREVQIAKEIINTFAK